jgi:hypothetical protein
VERDPLDLGHQIIGIPEMVWLTEQEWKADWKDSGHEQPENQAYKINHLGTSDLCYIYHWFEISSDA